MLKNVSQKFSGGCFLLVRRNEEAVIFLGTAFLIHEEGYLLTAAHLLEDNPEDLMVARPNDPDDFTPLSLDSVTPIGITVEKVDKVHNTALLRLSRKLHIGTPDHLAGQIDTIFLGSSILCLGFPFGHQDLHNLAVQDGIVSSKVVLKNGTRLLLIDSMVHDGMSGGPLVNTEDGRVVGIITGRFTPDEDGGDFTRGTSHPDYHTAFSYAVSIEYGLTMLEEQGLEVS